VLIPSLAMETSSLVAMEAMACGTPVVAFRSGALCELIRDGHTGFLVNSVEEMAEAIAAACSLDSRRCRTEAEQRFSAELMSANYLRLYEDIAKDASRPSSRMQTVEAA
jgi:glycosyltransferase involved in cell wall biosynthesis